MTDKMRATRALPQPRTAVPGRREEERREGGKEGGREGAPQKCKRRKEGNVLFNDALNTFYLRLYGVEYIVKDHSDSKRGNPLPPHGLLFPINSKGSFICTIPQTG